MNQSQLKIPDSVAELIHNLHPLIKRKIKVSLQMILSNPVTGKVLKDELYGLRSLRVSKFRIIYRISKIKQIEIIAIGPRERIYEETYRLIKKHIDN